MRNGCYLGTVKVMFKLMREWLIKSYAIKENVIHDLMGQLNCSADLLPADLGFLSQNHVLGQCIFGNEILMFDSNNSVELNNFYKGTFTGIKEEMEDLYSDDYLAALSGKVRVVLPYRSDKVLRNMIKRHMEENDLTREGIYEDQERVALLSNVSKMCKLAYFSFSDPYFMGTSRNYEAGVSMHIHTLVRALQYGGRHIGIRPMIEDREALTIGNYTAMILTRKDMPSSLVMVRPYQRIMAKVEESEMLFETCVPSQGRRHTRRRNYLFRTRELVLSADMSEIIGFMLGDKEKTSNRLMSVISDICELIEVPLEDFKKDPIHEIIEKFAFTDYPMLTFKKMLEEYMTNRVNYSVEIMMSDIDKGNALDNLIMVFCERTCPHTLYRMTAESKLMVYKDFLSTWISICREPDDFPMELMDLRQYRKEDLTQVSMTVHDQLLSATRKHTGYIA